MREECRFEKKCDSAQECCELSELCCEWFRMTAVFVLKYRKR